MKLFTTGHNKKKRAFTLIEIMLLLLVLSLIFASATSVITRKHKLKPRRTVHGQYICYRDIDDNLHELMFSGKSVLLDRSQAEDPTFTQCEFDAPASAPYLYVQLMGGGGAGGNANHQVGTGINSYRTINFPEGLNKSSYIDFLNAATTTGLTSDYIHTAAPSYNNKTPFSIRAFNKIIRDANLHVFAYDYTGASGSSGFNTQQYFLPSDYETELLSADEDPNLLYWYQGGCNPLNDAAQNQNATVSVTPFQCGQMLFGNGTSTFTTNAGSTLTYVDNAARTYCQLRSPMFKNCPWMKSHFQPTATDVRCEGGVGGSGGLLTTPIIPFELGVWYQHGKRYELDGDGNPIRDTVIDWGGDATEGWGDGPSCDWPVEVSVDVNNGKPGVLLPYDEACPNGVDGACYDIEGREIKNPINVDGYVASTSDYRQGYGTKEKCETLLDEDGIPYENCYQVEDTSNVIKDYFDIFDLLYTITSDGKVVTSNGSTRPSFYFNVYTEVNFKFKAQSYCTPNQPNNNNTEAEAGVDGGIPFFDDGNEGIKFCYNGSCHYYRETNSLLVDNPILSTAGQPVENYEPSQVINMDTGLLNNLNISAIQNCPAAEDGISGNKVVKKPAGYQYMYCSGSLGFLTDDQWMFLNSKVTSGNRDTFVTNTYKCPSYDSPYANDQVSNDTGDDKRLKFGEFGLKIIHKYTQGFLFYGERGGAGEYRAVFARTFGSSNLKMEPGRGGIAQGTITPGDATPAGNGEKSRLGSGCIDDNIDNCKVVYSTNGGVGGRSHITSSYQTGLLTSEEIYEYTQNPAKAPETKYSENYEKGTYLGEDSGFQSISSLTDLTGLIDDPEAIQNLGRGGNGGYVKHNCWLMPQYFVYFTKGTTYADNITDSNNYAVVPNIDAGTGYDPDGETLDEWEGYTNFSEAIIGNIDACKANGKSYQEQFEETPGENGYPGAIVIMW